MSETQTASTSNEENVDSRTVELLTKGVLEVYEPSLVTIKTHLKELTERQNLVNAALVVERRRLEDLQNDAVSDALIANVAMCRDRLVAISGSMVALHRRVAVLQARAENVKRVAISQTAKQKS